MQVGRRLMVEPGWSGEEEVGLGKLVGWTVWHRQGVAAVQEKLAD